MEGLLIVMDQLGEMDKGFEIAEEAIGKAKKEKKTEEARNMGMLIGQFLMLKVYTQLLVLHLVFVCNVRFSNGICI